MMKCNYSKLYICINQIVNMCLTEKMDSSSVKRFTASLDSILESLEDVDLAAEGRQVLHGLQSSWLAEMSN